MFGVRLRREVHLRLKEVRVPRLLQRLLLVLLLLLLLLLLLMLLLLVLLLLLLLLLQPQAPETSPHCKNRRNCQKWLRTRLHH